MPPKKSNANKRNNEQHIQGWFEYAERADNPDLPVVRYFNYLRNKGWGPKRIIAEGILALQEKRGEIVEGEPVVTDQTEAKLQQIFSVLERLAHTIEGAGLRLDGETQAALDQAHVNRQELSPLEMSLAGRLVAHRFDDDDEED